MPRIAMALNKQVTSILPYIAVRSSITRSIQYVRSFYVVHILILLICLLQKSNLGL